MWGEKLRFCYQLFILSLFVVTTGSAQEDLVQNEEPGWKSIQIPFDYKNIQVPSALWDSIKTVLRKDGVKESLIETFSVAPISLQVEIQSQEKLVLRDSMNFRILYIEGGGKLDLFD